MTDGLLMWKPYAVMISNGLKLAEYRNSKPPEDKLNVPIYILSGGRVYAKVMITSYFKTSTKYKTDVCWNWGLKLLESYKTPLHYEHPIGAQKWVKNVTLK